ncbi:MAG TPA: hypothetical protein ENN09_05730 [Planctomycetes bacterium]|nr:hypothetical protein [Planctomycetota bacterium]
MFRRLFPLFSAVLFVPALPAPAAAGEGVREELLFDFEAPGGLFENSDKLEYVPENATQGAKAGKIRLDQPFTPNFFFFGGSNMAGRWSDFDQFVIDVFVDGAPVKCDGFVVSDNKRDWWERYNYEFKLPPGRRRQAFSLGAFVRQRDQKPLDLSKLTFFAMRFSSDADGAVPPSGSTTPGSSRAPAPSK